MPTASAAIEVINLATLIHKVAAEKSTAEHDLESANADAARKQQQIVEMEKALAAALNLKFDAGVTSPLTSMLEAAKADLVAIQRRINAADHLRVAAALALDNLRKHQSIQDAAAAAGGMAHREAYVGG